MHYVFTILQIAAIFVTFIVIILLTIDKKISNNKSLLLTAEASFIYCIGCLLEQSSTTMSAAVTATKFKYIGACFIAMLMLRFVSRFSDIKPPKAVSWCLLLLNSFSLFLIMNCENNTLFFKDFSFNISDNISTLYFVPGLFFYIFMVITFFTVLCIIVISVISIMKRKRNNSISLILILIAILIPAVIKIYYILGLPDNIYDWTAPSFILSWAILITVLYKSNLFDIVSNARDSVIESMEDALIVVDTKMHIVDSNPEARRLFPIISKSSVNSSKRQEFLKELFDINKTQEFEIDSKFYQKHITTITDKTGDVKGYTVLILDVTKTKKYVDELILMRKKADMANNAKSDFLANMSHEIRTPMNAIAGFAELCLQEKNYTYANDIKSAAKNLIAIINDILDISKIESGKLELVLAPYDTMSLLNDVISIIYMQIGNKKNIEFKLDIDDSLPCKMYGDEVRIKQILINMLTNAVKFTKEGYIGLSIKCYHADTNTVTLKIKISDSGIGIKPEDINKLFANFQQLDTKKNREIEGTGLGLSISKNLINMMGGNITVESTYGKGTTFNIVISQKIEDNRKIAQYSIDMLADSTKTTIKSIISAPNAKVLVVDDNKVNLDVAVHLLRHYGIKADTASNGREAIDMINSNYYDIVYMDHMMPELDGVDTTKIIREFGDAYSKELPIIALTANAISGAKEMFLAHGFNDFISKPIDIKALEKSLSDWLPPHLIKHIEEKNSNISSEVKNNEEMFSIPNIDISSGLAYYAGDIKAYLSVLKTFQLTGKNIIAKIQEHLDRRDLKNYTIEVHGLKSSALTIGATSLSELAKELEIAAKENKLKVIIEKNPVLIARYQEILNDIAKNVDFNEESEIIKPPISDEELYNKLNSALHAVEEMEAKETIDILDDILNHSYKNNSMLSIIKSCRSDMESFQYEKAEDKLIKILKSVQ
jgi:signal transduction histidine kinase/FixJ family two-component response regulator